VFALFFFERNGALRKGIIVGELYLVPEGCLLSLVW